MADRPTRFWALGCTVHADYRMQHRTWSGGPSGHIVLITNRKVASSAYLDDRAVTHRVAPAPAATRGCLT